MSETAIMTDAEIECRAAGWTLNENGKIVFDAKQVDEIREQTYDTWADCLEAEFTTYLYNVGAVVHGWGLFNIKAMSPAAALTKIKARAAADEYSAKDFEEFEITGGHYLAYLDGPNEGEEGLFEGVELAGEPGYEKLLEFAKLVARLSSSNDMVDDGGGVAQYQHDTGSSLDALDELISKARELVADRPSDFVRDATMEDVEGTYDTDPVTGAEI